MQKDAKIFVAGHRGLAGSAIVRKLRALGHENLVLRTRQELDLQDSAAVRSFFEDERPEFVFLAAAKVGGRITEISRRSPSAPRLSFGPGCGSGSRAMARPPGRAGSGVAVSLPRGGGLVLSK